MTHGRAVAAPSRSGGRRHRRQPRHRPRDSDRFRAGEVEATGRRALAVATDVTDEAQVQALAERTLTAFGRIDILVNNAGISFPAPFAQTPLKRWDLVMNVNLRGPVMCTQAFLPKMLEQGSGRIINISSYLAEAMMPGMMSYSVSKIALEKLSQYPEA